MATSNEYTIISISPPITPSPGHSPRANNLLNIPPPTYTPSRQTAIGFAVSKPFKPVLNCKVSPIATNDIMSFSTITVLPGLATRQ